MALQEEVYKAIAELRVIAAAGLQFASSPYETMRYERIQAICARLIAAAEQAPFEDALALLQGELFTDHVSPVSTADAVVQRGDTILLIRRHDNGLWALPGGLVEVNHTLAETAILELQEETGLVARVDRLLGIFDSQRWDSQEKVHLHHAIFLMADVEGEPISTSEALDTGWFAENNLPPLSPGHHLRVPFVFQLLRGEHDIPYLDLPPIL